MCKSSEHFIEPNVKVILLLPLQVVGLVSENLYNQPIQPTVVGHSAMCNVSEQ